jgi:hypothetical protein
MNISFGAQIPSNAKLGYERIGNGYEQCQPNELEKGDFVKLKAEEPNSSYDYNALVLQGMNNQGMLKLLTLKGGEPKVETVKVKDLNSGWQRNQQYCLKQGRLDFEYKSRITQIVQ